MRRPSDDPPADSYARFPSERNIDFRLAHATARQSRRLGRFFCATAQRPDSARAGACGKPTENRSDFSKRADAKINSLLFATAHARPRRRSDRRRRYFLAPPSAGRATARRRAMARCARLCVRLVRQVGSEIEVDVRFARNRVEIEAQSCVGRVRAFGFGRFGRLGLL